MTISQNLYHNYITIVDNSLVMECNLTPKKKRFVLMRDTLIQLQTNHISLKTCTSSSSLGFIVNSSMETFLRIITFWTRLSKISLFAFGDSNICCRSKSLLNPGAQEFNIAYYAGFQSYTARNVLEVTFYC